MEEGGDVGEGSFSLAASGNRRQLQIPESAVPTISIWKWISLVQGGDGAGWDQNKTGVCGRNCFIERINLRFTY